MISKYFSVLLGMFLLVSTDTLQARPDVKVELLKQDDISQSLRLAFWLDATPDCVLESLIDYRHVEQVSDTVDSVKLITTTDGRQVVSYHYDGLFYNYEAMYYRWPDSEKGEIRYQLIEHKQSGIPVPHLTHSSGRYTVSAKSNGTRVTLSQVIAIEQSIFSSLYLRHAYSETVNFVENLIKYIQARCKSEAAKEVK